MNGKLRISSGHSGLFTQSQQRKNAMALMQLLLLFSASVTCIYARHSWSEKHHFGHPVIDKQLNAWTLTNKLGKHM